MKNHYFFFLFIFLNFSSFAQYFPLSEGAEISIITIGPGDNLYDKFGHSAFRIKDDTNELDLIYNYGVYDFDTPNFYTKFAQGKLLYKLAINPYQAFLDSYIAQNRWVEEQVLNVSYTEKQKLFNFLQKNALPENKYYQYDFFYDNCATKIRDVLVSVLGDSLEYKTNLASEGLTFRQLIQKNVHYNSWGSMGMDVAIGAVVDRKASSWEYQFLPEYISKAAAGATIARGSSTVPLVKETRRIYDAPERELQSNFFMSPLFLFSLLGLLILFITYKDYKSKKRSRKLDSVIFFTTGLIGFILTLLWFATDHTATVNNYNLLWAFPFSIVFFLHIEKRIPKHWIARYIFFMLVLLVLLTFHWVTGVQVFAISMAPLFFALIVRYLYVIRFLKRQKG